jgi:protein-tyrosine phosphatase
MKTYNRIIFVGKSGTSREPMAKGILEDFSLNRPVEVLARGLVVLFPEPINQKAEAILISNGIHMEGFTSVQLTEEDLAGDTLTLTMERTQRERLLEMYGEDKAEDIQVLTDLVGDELEILDPYGGALPSYGLCYETLRKSIKKLVKLLNDNERTVTNEGE